MSNRPTEQDGQLFLARFCKSAQHQWIAPNVNVYGWESDLLSMTRSGLVHEFEIKTSRSDFLREFKSCPETYLKVERQRRLYAGGENIPNYFWFVLSHRVELDPSEVPAFAGVMVFNHEGDYLYPKIVHPAPRITRVKRDLINDSTIVSQISNRLWKSRGLWDF